MSIPAPDFVYVPPLLPTCENQQFSASDATPEGAEAFRPDTTSYWLDSVLVSTVPGLVLGILSAICMIVLIGWTVVAFCRCGCTTKRRRRDASKGYDMEDPFAEDGRMMSAPQVTYSDRLPADELRSPSRPSRRILGPAVSSLKTNASMRTRPSTGFSSSSSYSRDEVNAQFGLPRDLTCVERYRVKQVLCCSIGLMAAATVGVAAWGIWASVQYVLIGRCSRCAARSSRLVARRSSLTGFDRSIFRYTDEIVPGFWGVYGQAQGVATDVFSLLSRLSTTVASAEARLRVLSQNAGELSALAAGTAGTLGAVGQSVLASAVGQLNPVLKVGTALACARSLIPGGATTDSLTCVPRPALNVQRVQVLEDIKEPLREAVDISNNTFISGLNEFRQDVEPTTLVVNDTARFIVIGVVFGLVIFCALVASALTIGARYPRWGATMTIILWFMVAILMLLGVGLLDGFKYLSSDGCLYAESFVMSYATRLDGDSQQYAVKAINYYLDPGAADEYIPGQALTQIVDPLAAQLLALSEQPEIQSFLDLVPTAVQQLSASPEISDALQGLATEIPALQLLLTDIDREASRVNVRRLYSSTKEYLCCSLSSDLSELYEAWVATGCLGLVLSILVTWRLVWFVRTDYPKSVS